MQRSTSKKVAATVAILVAVGAFMSFGVFSSFSTTQSNSSNLTSATFGLTQLPGTLLDAITGLLPGDSITRCVKLTNSGDSPITITAKPSMPNVSGTLNSVATMTMDKVSGVDTGSSALIKACTAASGETVTSTASIFGSTAGSALTNHTLSGDGTGGRWEAGESHVYQIVISMPSGLTDFATYGGKSITPTVNFQADQIAGSAK